MEGGSCGEKAMEGGSCGERAMEGGSCGEKGERRPRRSRELQWEMAHPNECKQLRVGRRLCMQPLLVCKLRRRAQPLLTHQCHVAGGA